MRHARLAVVLLRGSALAFGFFGMAFTVAPGLCTWVDIRLDSATASTDVRAIFGGLELGLGLFVAWCSLNRDRHVPGSVLVVLVFACMVGARLLGLAVDGDPSWLTGALLVAEMGGLAAGFGALWASGPAL